VNRKEAAAAAKKRLQQGYFSAGEIWTTCPAPCRQKLTIDRFTRKTDIQDELFRVLVGHLMEEH
jgi:hypothetical protein